MICHVLVVLVLVIFMNSAHFGQRSTGERLERIKNSQNYKNETSYSY